MDDRHTAFADAATRCKRVLREHPKRKQFHLTLDRAHLELFLEYLQSTDPDMPPPPVCKTLGPLVGDIVMNEKLHRLDALADRLGTLVIYLEKGHHR